MGKRPKTVRHHLANKRQKSTVTINAVVKNASGTAMLNVTFDSTSNKEHFLSFLRDITTAVETGQVPPGLDFDLLLGDSNPRPAKRKVRR